MWQTPSNFREQQSKVSGVSGPKRNKRKLPKRKHNTRLGNQVNERQPINTDDLEWSDYVVLFSV